MEKRRENSKVAARDRRAKETDVYDDLKLLVPIVEEPTVTHVDRIAMLRVATAVCRFRKNVGDALTTAPDSARLLRRSFQREVQGESPWSEDSLTACLDGFILVADSDGVILYVTESVSLFLGITQTDFAGRHLKDFIASDDYSDYLACTQQLTAEEDLEMNFRSLVLRIKTVISPRGRNLNMKSAMLKPVSFNIRVLPSAAGHCHVLHAVTVPAGLGTASVLANTMLKAGETPSGTFMTRHTCDMRLSHVPDALVALLQMQNEGRSLMGYSYYNLLHPADADRFRESICELLEKTQTRTPYYRLVTGVDTVAWIMTEASLISQTTRGQKGHHIIAVHHLIGHQTEDECSMGSCIGTAAACAVRIKEEPDEREYLARQPDLIEGDVHFPDMTGDPGEFQPVALKKNEGRGAAFGDISNGPVVSAGNNTNAAASTRKQSYDEVLQWLFRGQPEGTGRAAGEGEGGAEEGWRGDGRGGGGGGRGEQPRQGYGIQALTATTSPPCDPLPAAAAASVAARRATIGSAADAARLRAGGVVVGDGLGIGVGGRGGGGRSSVLLQGATLQQHSQQLHPVFQPRRQQQRHPQPLCSPQNAMPSSSSFDISSPTGGCPPRTSTPVAVANIERELRAEALLGGAFEGGRIGCSLSQTGAFPLPYAAGRGGERGYAASQDVLGAVPPAGFSAAQPLAYGARRGQKRVNKARRSSSSSYTPMYATAAGAGASVSSSAASVCEVAPATCSVSGHGLYREDSGFDMMMSDRRSVQGGAISRHAPFIDPSYDIPVGVNKDLGSLLDLPPWNEADGLPNFNQALPPPADPFLPGAEAAFKRAAHDAQSALLFDDWPTWIDQNPSPFDGRM